MSAFAPRARSLRACEPPAPPHAVAHLRWPRDQDAHSLGSPAAIARAIAAPYVSIRAANCAHPAAAPPCSLDVPIAYVERDSDGATRHHPLPHAPRRPPVPSPLPTSPYPPLTPPAPAPPRLRPT